MDAISLNLAVKNHLTTRQYFTGTFPWDIAPPITNYPASMILNTDPHNKPGQHWVSLYFDKSKHCSYFDSFGLLPSENIENYIKKFSVSFDCNSKMLQSFCTTTCGQFCLYFLYWRSRGRSMNAIVGKLNGPYIDELVCNFVSNVYHIKV
jgi:Adenovirus endoprotease